MDFEEDTYSTIFNALKHPIRRRILRIIDEDPSTYTEIQIQLNIDNGLLNYHLENMRSLLFKEENGDYNLSDFGHGATVLLERVEQPVTSRVDTILGLSPLQIKSIMVIFIFCLGALAFSHVELNTKYNVLETRYDLLRESQTEAQKSLESEIVFETLQMAIVEKRIPTYGSITHNTSTIILSTKRIEDVNVPRRVGGYKLLLLSPEEIEAKAMAEGDFLYLIFTKFDPNPENIMVKIQSEGIFNVVGGMTIQFTLTGTIYQIWIS
jgi:hypothetical protein